MNNFFLFLTSVLIWGSTWLVITFQLGVVDPIVSIVYRMGLSAAIIFLYCFIKKRTLRFDKREHVFMALQGIFLFGLNYWATYHSEHYITSALAAVISTMLVYFNVALGRIFLQKKVEKSVVIGASLGFVGVIMIFAPEISIDTESTEVWLGMGLACLGTFLASIGNIFSARNQAREIPVVQANAWSMFYAGVFMTVVAVVMDIPFNMDWSAEYVGALLYLSVFGSVIAFGAYLSLLGKIGAAKAGYVVLVYPVVALLLSTLYEGYHWTIYAAAGVALIGVGNLIAMNKVKLAASRFNIIRKEKKAAK